MLSEKLRVLDLFSGIGGFSLGLERTGGFETVAFCEMNEYADKVLEKHWPDVVCYEDVKMITKERLDQDEIGQIDVICGGFPCQDISLAGKGAGLSGERSGLWFEYLRIIDEVGPRWVIIENVSALRGRGLSTVLQNLSEIGYDAEWHCITASYVGAPHRRDRIWIVAHRDGECGETMRGECEDIAGEGSCGGVVGSGRNGDVERKAPVRGAGENTIVMANTKSNRRDQRKSNGKGCVEGNGEGEKCGSRNVGETVAYPTGQRQQGSGKFSEWGRTAENGKGEANISLAIGQHREWAVEPDVGRVAHGVPKRVDRLRCLGNAVVPQIPEMIGYAILETYHAE